MPFQPGFRGRSPLTVAIFATATSTGTPGALSYPASIVAGDAIFLCNSGRNNVGGAADVNPAGYTQIVNDTTLGNVRVKCWVRLADGTESGGTPGLNGGVENDRWIMVFRGSRKITSITIGSTNVQQTDSAPAGQTITLTGQPPPAIAIAGYRTSGSVTTRGFSPAADAEITPSTRLYGKYKVFNSAPADESISQSDDGISNTLFSFRALCAG